MSGPASGPANGGVLVRAALAPMLADASVRSEQVTQLLLGETAELLEARGEWRRLRAHADGYEGWVNAGYLRAASAADVEGWRAQATGWSEGARVNLEGHGLVLPLGARVALARGGTVTLPDGRRGQVVAGYVRPAAEIEADARETAVERWALDRFEGAPYEWGGRTPWGVDCSGVVQAAYAARGVALPRDSSKQALCGEPVAPDAIQPGDLLFFHGEHGPGGITHVAFAGPGETLIHSTIVCGGMLMEPRGAGSRAEDLMRRLVAVRRVAG